MSLARFTPIARCSAPPDCPTGLPLLFGCIAGALMAKRAFWTFGAKAMTKDLVLGLLLAPVIERFGRVSSSSDRACRRGRAYLRTASTGQV